MSTFNGMLMTTAESIPSGALVVIAILAINVANKYIIWLSISFRSLTRNFSFRVFISGGIATLVSHSVLWKNVHTDLYSVAILSFFSHYNPWNETLILKKGTAKANKVWFKQFDDGVEWFSKLLGDLQECVIKPSMSGAEQE